MRLRLTLLLYNLLLPFGLLILLPVSLLKMRRRGGYGPAFLQRFGHFDPETRARLTAGQDRSWWIHAVSVGEVNVAKKLIAEILRRDPSRPLVLSVTTSTGHAVARDGAPPGLTVIYSPVDAGWIAGRVLTLIRPEKYILMEAEVWPNLVHRANRRGIPVALANARLSPRSERRYRRFRAVTGPVFSMLDLVMVQEAGDVPRWAGIGVPEERLTVTGSIKYDQSLPPDGSSTQVFRELLHRLWSAPLPPLLLASSTHPGEEKALGEVYQALRREFPALRWLVAPRHAERRAAVAADLASLGLRAALRSALPGAPEDPDVLIIDSTGELAAWEALASAVVIGKSFLAAGGQNPAPAIAAGVPVFTGPHMENFLPLMELLERVDGITRTASLKDLQAALCEALNHPGDAKRKPLRGRDAMEPHRGAAGRTAAALTALRPR